MILVPWMIWAFTVLAWVSAVILGRAAHGARIGALTERSVAAWAIAIFGTVYSLVVANTELVRVVSTSDAMVIVRAAVLLLLAVPIYWTVLYVTGKLGDGT